MTRQPTHSYRGYDFSLTDRIIGACIEVHRTLGPGFQETIYQRALELELASTGLEFSREVEIPVYYKGQQIGTRRVDFVIEGCMLEIKAKSVFAPEDYVQAESYVKAADCALGLLVNFGGLKIEIKRIANHAGNRH
ncbi:MAG TPA: GxxExxY protein [Roseiflexaceae bacterium]